MRILKRIVLVFLWLLIPSAITVSFSMFGHFVLGALPTVLLYVPFFYLIRKTARGDFDGKYSNTDQITSTEISQTDKQPQPHFNLSTSDAVLEDTFEQKATSTSEVEPPVSPSLEKPEVTSASTSDPVSINLESDQASDSGTPATDESSMKYCDNCGTGCEIWTQYCPLCGSQKFSVLAKVPFQASKPSKKEKGFYRYSRKLIPILSLVLCLALSVSLIVMGSKYKNLRHEHEETLDMCTSLRESNQSLQMKYNGLVDENNDLENQLSDVRSSLQSSKTAYRVLCNLIDYSAGFFFDDEEGMYYHSSDCPKVRLHLAILAEDPFSPDVDFMILDHFTCEALGSLPHDCVS